MTNVLRGFKTDVSFDRVWKKVTNIFVDIARETEFWLDFSDQISQRRR
jgi:hypothetical protein